MSSAIATIALEHRFPESELDSMTEEELDALLNAVS